MCAEFFWACFTEDISQPCVVRVLLWEGGWGMLAWVTWLWYGGL